MLNNAPYLSSMNALAFSPSGELFGINSNMAEHEDVVWMHTERVITIVDLARYCEVAEAELRELVEYGALEPADPGAEPLAFDAECAPQVRSALRLCHDLELESASAPLVLSLLERIHQLEERLQQLSAKGGRP